jgi:peptide/nickel transport system permease protein
VLKIVLGRVARLIVTLLIVTFAAFLLINLLPGDPARQLIPDQYANAENVARLRDELGFDRPIIVRYADWLGDAVQGDLGQSYRSRLPVTESIRDRLPITLELVVLTQGIALFAALIIAPLAATRRGSMFDRASTIGVSAAVSIPSFTLAIAAIFVFAVKLHWLPSTGFVPISESITGNLKSVTLPSLALALEGTAVYVQALRSEMSSVLSEDFVTLARGRGLSPRYVLFRHVLRPSSLPLLSLFGIYTGGLLGGAALIETIFSLPGLGRLTVDSITNQDYLMVQGIVVFITVSYVLVNFAVDLLYAVMDPRIRVKA